MNQEFLKLKRLRDNVIDIEVQIGLVESDILAVEKDVFYLENLYEDLKENLQTIKADGIIVSASEYKKIIQEYVVIRKNLTFYTDLHTKLLGDFDMLRSKRERIVQEYESFKKDYESRSVVVQFDPSRKKK